MFGGQNAQNPARAQGAGDVGEAVASFTQYEAAQKAVSQLIAADVAARDIAIVGRGLRSVERVTGKLGYATAARSGAVNGVLIGLFFAAILVIGSPVAPIQAFVGVIFVGIAVGMILSLITYAFVRRRRNYASVMQVIADHYDVTVTAASIHRARQVIGHGAAPAGEHGMPHPGAAPVPPAAHPSDPPAPHPSDPPPAGAIPPVTSPADDEEPPRYGERIKPPTDQQG